MVKASPDFMARNINQASVIATGAPAARAEVTRYKVDAYLAQGGMGSLYLGRKIGAHGFERAVVLKQLRSDLVTAPAFWELFVREAKLSARLDHVNIVRTLDLVKLGRSHYIVMEYVDGADLRTLLRRIRLRGRRLHPAAVVHIGLELLSGLAYAHTRTDGDGRALGIVHRDLSPSNILVSGAGEVKVSDFGISTMASAPEGWASAARAGRSRVRGTLGYMAPEQALNLATDARSDVYSLAVALYEALTGERLFGADLQAPGSAYTRPVPPLDAKRSGLPPLLDVAMRRALVPQAELRYPNARAFAAALRAVATGERWMCSADALAAHLRDVAGPPQCWRNHQLVAVQTSTSTIPTGGRPGENLDAATALDLPLEPTEGITVW